MRICKSTGSYTCRNPLVEIGVPDCQHFRGCVRRPCAGILSRSLPFHCSSVGSFFFVNLVQENEMIAGVVAELPATGVGRVRGPSKSVALIWTLACRAEG